MRHGGRDTDLGDAVKAARAERRGDFKVGVRDGGDTAAREDGGREPDGKRDKERTCGNRRGEGDEYNRNPCGRGDRAEHADERLNPVGEGLVEADRDAGQHADDCAAEPADEQQTRRVGKAFGEKRAVLEENAEHAVKRGEVEDRQNGELYGQQVENVEEQCRACVKVRFVFELLAERGTEKRHGVKDEVHDERRAQQPDEIGMLCGGVLQIVRQHDVQNERQRDGQNRQDFCKMLHGLGTPFNKKSRKHTPPANRQCSVAHSPCHKGAHTTAAVHTQTTGHHAVHSSHHALSFQFISILYELVWLKYTP